MAQAASFHNLDGRAFKEYADFTHTLAGFAAEKPDKAFGKAVCLTIEWLRYFDGISEDNPTASNLHFQSKCFKLFHSGPIKVVKGLFSGKEKDNSLNYATTRLWQDPSMANVAQEIRSINSLVGPAYDTFDLGAKAFFSVDKTAPALVAFKNVNSMSLVLGMGWNVVDTCVKIGSQETAEKQIKLANEKLFDTIVNISYIAIGVLALLSAYFAFVFEPIIFTALSTSTLIFGMLDYFNKNLGKEIKPLI